MFETFVTPWTLARHTPLSMEFSRQEYWSGMPFPSPEDLPDSGVEPSSPALWADSLPSKLTGKPYHAPSLALCSRGHSWKHNKQILDAVKLTVQWICERDLFFCFYFILWLWWVFVAACWLSPVEMSRNYPLPQCTGFSFSCWGAQALGMQASVTPEYRLSTCSTWG